MPISQFADPTVAIEPPPQASDFEAAYTAQMMIQDPFNVTGWWDGSASSSAPVPNTGKSWTDVFTDAGRSFLDTFAKNVAGKATGYNPNDPSQVAALAAAREREAKAEQQKTFLIVGGVAAAIVVGVLVLRKGKR